MKKLYYSVLKDVICFVVNGKENSSLEFDPASLKKTAWKYHMEQINICNVPNTFSIKEVKSPSEVPEEWQDESLIWGSDEEETAESFFYNLSEFEERERSEYQTYLKLHAKYGQGEKH